jgi:hypothetical protein
VHPPARLFSALLLLFALVGCVSRSDVNRAAFALEAAWQNDYEAVLDEDGIRRYALPRAEAFDALLATAKRMRMVVREVDEKRGFIMLAALAPTPLTQAEWKSVYEMELPRMRKIISEEIGHSRPPRHDPQPWPRG